MTTPPPATPPVTTPPEVPAPPAVATPEPPDQILQDIRSALRQLMTDLRTLLIAYLVMSGPGR